MWIKFSGLKWVKNCRRIAFWFWVLKNIYSGNLRKIFSKTCATAQFLLSYTYEACRFTNGALNRIYFPDNFQNIFTETFFRTTHQKILLVMLFFPSGALVWQSRSFHGTSRSRWKAQKSVHAVPVVKWDSD